MTKIEDDRYHRGIHMSVETSSFVAMPFANVLVRHLLQIHILTLHEQKRLRWPNCSHHHLWCCDLGRRVVKHLERYRFQPNLETLMPKY